MSRERTYCRSVIVFCINIAKFVVDIPFYCYAFICSILACWWKWLTSRRKDLVNETVLITGAASGLGQHITLKLAKLSNQVVLVLWDINQAGLEETADKCRSLGVHNIHTYRVDLSNHTEVVRTANLVRQQVGSVTMLINNAGISPYKLFLDSDPDTEEKVVRVNLLSQMWTIREFLPAMIQNRKGHLVSTCAGLALMRFRYLSSYTASKHGLRGFLETLKLEMEVHPEKPPIKFTVIYPGWVKTPMTSGISWEPRYEIDVLRHLDADLVAEKIVDGVLKEQEEVFFPAMVKHLIFLQGYMPTSFANRLENYVLRNIKLVQYDASPV